MEDAKSYPSIFHKIKPGFKNIKTRIKIGITGIYTISTSFGF